MKNSSPPFSAKPDEFSEVLVVGIVKDVSSTLETDIAILSKALRRFSRISWYLVESDSSDGTLEELDRIEKTFPKFDYVSLGKLETKFPNRTERLAFARNAYVEAINKFKLSAAYVVVADFNGLNSKINAEAIDSCWINNDWSVCTANQEDNYYDIWALRHHLWSPNDCWEQHEFYRKFLRNPEKALMVSVHSRMIHIPRNSEWIEVESAFGGLAIYKKEYFAGAKYGGLTHNQKSVCEHVSLHEFMRSKGARIFINPSLINTDFTDHSLESMARNKLKRYLYYPLKFFKAMMTNDLSKT